MPPTLPGLAITWAKSAVLRRLCGYQRAGHVLFRPAERDFAIVVHGRVRLLTAEQLMTIMKAEVAI